MIPFPASWLHVRVLHRNKSCTISQDGLLNTLQAGSGTDQLSTFSRGVHHLESLLHLIDLDVSCFVYQSQHNASDIHSNIILNYIITSFLGGYKCSSLWSRLKHFNVYLSDIHDSRRFNTDDWWSLFFLFLWNTSTSRLITQIKYCVSFSGVGYKMKTADTYSYYVTWRLVGGDWRTLDKETLSPCTKQEYYIWTHPWRRSSINSYDSSSVMFWSHKNSTSRITIPGSSVLWGL